MLGYLGSMQRGRVIELIQADAANAMGDVIHGSDTVATEFHDFTAPAAFR